MKIHGIYEYALLNRMTIKDGKEISFLRYIEQKIDESPDKRFTIDIKKMKEALGLSIRNALSKNGIVMKRKQYGDGSIMITMSCCDSRCL